jgi:branched-chain amino acid transport system substrate-binding protein
VFLPSFRPLRRPRRLVVAAWLALSCCTLASCNLPIFPPRPQASPPQAGAPPSYPGGVPPAANGPVVPPEGPFQATPGEGAATRVGLLVPLSGSNAQLGRALLDAAQMALYEVGDDKLQLMPRDTQGAPAAAAEAARQVIAGGARLIIGPLTAGEVEAVKPVASAAGVPVLAFSTATQLAGDGTYLMGFLPRQEIERVTAYAHAHGMNKLAVLAPRSPYGEIAVEALRGAAQTEGAAVDRVEYYDPAAADLAAPVRRLAGRAGFDALLLPEGGAKLKALAPLLPYYDIDPDKVKYLGTGLWDDPSLGSEPALVGSWYAAPSPASRADFEKRFRELYNHAPPRLATLGYDATALAAVLAQGPHGADFSPAALTSPNGFSGIDGVFRLRPDGLVQRGLAVIEIHRGGNTIVDPAPEGFQQASF